MRAARLLALLAAAILTVGCMTNIGADGQYVNAEWGGSELVTTTAQRRVTTYPDGRVVEETGISEEHAVNYGLSENLKGFLVGIIGYLVGGGV